MSQASASPVRKGRRTLIGFVVVAVGLAAVAFWVGRDTQHPPRLQSAASIRMQLTAPVRMRVVEDSDTASGRVKPSDQTTLSIPDDVDVANGGIAVISKVLTHLGQTLTEGDVLTEVSGQPVFLLEGSVPAYRTLYVGDSGGDVLQLQQSLQRLGLLSVTTGTFDAATSDAVASLFLDRGYTAPTGLNPDASAPSDKKPHPKPQVYLPRTAIVFTPTLPARVITNRIKLGASPAASKIVVSDGPHVIAARLDQPGGSLKVGDRVRWSVTGASGHGTGKIKSITGSGAITITPTRPLRESLWADPVVVTVILARTPGPVLAVPASAISTTAAGTAEVYVESVDQQTPTAVPVTVGVSGDGYVEVHPSPSGALAAGVNVLIAR